MLLSFTLVDACALFVETGAFAAVGRVVVPSLTVYKLSFVVV